MWQVFWSFYDLFQALSIYPTEGKKAKATVTWLLNLLVNCNNDDLSILFDYPREKNDIFTTLGELRKNPEIGSQTLNDAPPEIRLSLASQSVREFKSRKKFVECAESMALSLADILVDAKLLSRS